jgi:hypothetical protein
MLIFKMYVLPLLDYCSEIYNPPSNSALAKHLEKPLRKFTRSVFHRCNVSFDSYFDRLNYINMPSQVKRRLIFDLVYVFKCIRNLSHQPSFFNYVRLSRLGRNPYRLIRITKNCGSFYDQIVPIWNKFCHLISDTTSVNTYKKTLEATPEYLFLISN